MCVSNVCVCGCTRVCEDDYVHVCACIYAYMCVCLIGPLRDPHGAVEAGVRGAGLQCGGPEE